MNQNKLVVFCEKILSQEECVKYNNRDPVRIANYAFYAPAKHSFLKYVLDLCCEPSRRLRPILADNDILESTGPGLFTTAYHNYIKITSNNCFTTIVHPSREMSPLCACQSQKHISCAVGDFGYHLHMGSWRENNS